MLAESVDTITLAVSAIVLSVAGLILAFRSARQSGKSKVERDVLLDGERRREAFDEEVNRPLAFGDDLIRRLRKRVGR